MSERLQRWELWEDGYDAVDVHMRKVRPGATGPAIDEWCKAEEVSDLEAILAYATTSLADATAMLADAHAELADAQNRELYAKIEKRDEEVKP